MYGDHHDQPSPPQKSLGGDCERAVQDAIDAGYRHIDTAYFYENEDEVGKAVQKKIAEGVIKREDIFIVSKVIISKHRRSGGNVARKGSLTFLIIAIRE